LITSRDVPVSCRLAFPVRCDNLRGYIICCVLQ